MKTRRKKKPALKEGSFTIVHVPDEIETVCQVCYAEFLDEEDLKLHISQVHVNESDVRSICKICLAVLSSDDEFVSHFIFNHLESCMFCCHCARAFSDTVVLDQHELKHGAVLDDLRIMCSQCSIVFTDKQKLQHHEFQEHGDNNDGIILNRYFALLSSALNMKIKKFLDCLCRKKALVCRKCKYSSVSIKDYIEHLRISKCSSLVCDKCLNVYKRKFSIITHMLGKPECHNYIAENITKATCTECGKIVDSRSINEHKKSCNFIKCSTCGKAFESVFELTEHRTLEHNISINLQVCKFCKKEFVGTVNLKNHMMRTHKNKSLYKYNCVYCDCIFAHPRKLFAHFFTRHKHIQPYTCKICNKCFKLRKHFTIHIKLEHKSIGFVEFDENLHVIFTDKKSEHPVTPNNVNVVSSSDSSDSDCNDASKNKSALKRKKGTETYKETISVEQVNTTQSTEIGTTAADANVEHSGLKSPNNIIEIESEPLNSPRAKKKRLLRTRYQQKRTEEKNSSKISDDSEEEPLSNIRDSLLKKKSMKSKPLTRRIATNEKRLKLTCKLCHKYCYTVLNYQHHMTLHEKTKMKRCIKCNEYFISRQELQNHVNTAHASSKLIETLKSVLAKRKSKQPQPKPASRPSESLKFLLEKRKKEQLAKAQNSVSNKFRRTIQKVNFIDDCKATITPISDHGLSVKNFIENFKPEGDSVNISNSVTIKAMDTPLEKEPSIKMRKFNPEPLEMSYKLSFPVKFKDPPADYMNSKVSVKLVQQLITRPKLVNMCYNERIPVVQEKTEPDEYCNMFADETDYTQYKNDVPEVAHEVMLGDPEDIPRTRRLAQEIIIPKIPEKYGGVRIGHLLPQAPYYKIVKVKKLIQAANEPEPEPPEEDKDVKLPDGTRLISVKNPYPHLIPNEHLEEVLKANRSKYYTPKEKNIEKAIAKALTQIKTPRERKVRNQTKKNAKGSS